LRQALLQPPALPVRLMRPTVGVVLLALLAVALAGCSGRRSTEPVAKLNCPVAFIAPGLDAYTVSRTGAAPSTNTNDIAFGVKLTSLNATCRNEVKGVRVDTLLTFIAVRSDDNLRYGDFTYFVAIADAQQNIIAKQNFALRVNFAERQKQMRVVDEITENLPLRDISLGNRYAVIVGLQVSKQQLDLNRQRE
jgi:hypothetical protein